MSSTPQRQGFNLSNGVKTFRSVKTRLFAASAFLLVAAFVTVSVTAANPNQTTLATSSANTQQAGFVASAITELLSFFGLAEAEPAAFAPQVCVAPPQAADMTAWFTGNGVVTDIAPQDAVADVAVLTNGATYGTGRVGQGFSLDGVNDYVAVASSVDTDVDATGGGNISMDAWINPGTTATGQPIAEYGTPTDTGVHFWHSVAGLGGAGSLFANVVDNAGNNHLFYSAVIPGFTTGALQHVAFTFNNATDTAVFYHNGTAFPNISTAGQQALPIADIETDYPLNIGARIDTSNSPATFFQGIIDEFELYDAVLTPASVAAIFNAPAGEGKCSGAFDYSVATQTVAETGGALLVTVNRSGDLTVGATVQVFTANGSAVSVDGTGCAAGNDFQGFSSVNPITLNFAPGVTSQQFSVNICDDAIAEPNETFTLGMQNPTGPSSIGTTTPVQTVTITDGADTAVSVTTTPMGGVAEDGMANLIYTFSRASAGAGAITVNFTIGGTATSPGSAGTVDYACSAGTGATAVTCTGTTGTITFAAGATTAQLVVDPTPDTTANEGNETVIITVAPPTAPAANYTVGNPSSATNTINEDDTDVSVTVAPASVAENGPTNLVYTFTRSGALTAGQVVNFTVGGTACSLAPCTDNFPPDYTVTGATTFTGTNGTVAGTGSVTFVGNATTATVTVDPTPDANVEPAETVIFTVTPSTGINAVAPTSATGTINNDDTTYTVAATPPTANEGNANNVPDPQGSGRFAGSVATFTVTRTGDLSTTGQVDIASVPTLDPLPANTERAMGGPQNSPCGTAGIDFINDGATLTFNPGVMTQTFTVLVCGDTIFEQNEVFDAILSNPVNGTIGVPARATYTIDDDDAFPILRISDASATEGNNIVFTVTQVDGNGNPLVSGSATTFRFCTTDVTATEGVDYTGQPCPGGSGTQTIAAGSTSTTFSIPTAVDIFFEGPETFLVDLIDIFNATTVGGDGQGVGTINDGQAPNSFMVNDVAQAEGSNPGATTSFNFVITRSAPAQGNQLVCFRTQAGTTIPPGNANPATPGTAPGNPPGADYTEILSNPPNNCITFTAGGPDSQIVPVIVYQDQVYENDESFTFIIESVTTTGGPVIPAANFSDTGLGTILNDDLAPFLRVRTVDAMGNTITSQSESVTPYRFRIERVGQSQLDAGFAFSTSDGPAPFTAPTGTGPATGGTTPCGTPAVPSKDYISVNSAAPPPVSATNTIPGSITGGTPDMNGVSAFIEIPVTICNDSADELDETFVGRVTSPTNAVINAANATTNPSGALARINDDDASPIVTVSDVTLAEGNTGTTAFNFTITLSGNTATQPIVVTYSTVDGTATVADNDYQPIVAGTQTFQPGETTKTVTVLVNGDLNFETDERFTLQVTSATGASIDPNLGADAIGLGTILNDDGPRTFAIDNVTQAEGNDPTNPTLFRFRVTGTGQSAITQTVNFTTADGTAVGGAGCANPGTGAVDYVSQMGTLTFAPGGTTFQDILVAVCGDLVQEANETFTVTISSTVPGTVPPVGSVGTGTIVNDDALSFRVDNVTGQEGQAGTTNFVFRISRDGATSLSSNVSFVIEPTGTNPATGGAACTPGVDYISTPSPTSPVTFAAGTTFVNVTVQVCGDTIPEFDETFQLRLTSTTNGTISPTNNIGLGTIVNDDGPVVPQGFEGDINRAVVGVCGPGDGQYTAADSAQFKRFIAGLDTPCTDPIGPNNEFMRTDTADENTLGDGRLTAADQQQIDNYIAQLDPRRNAGGPAAPIPAAPLAERSASKSVKGDSDAVIETGGGREVRGVDVTGAPGTDVLYAVNYISQGNETVTTLSIQFNQAIVSINGTSGTNNNPDVIAGANAPAGMSRTVNATQVAQGRIGVLLDFQGALPAGTQQVVVFRFRIAPGAAAGTYPVTFVDQPIVRSTSDANAQALTAKYTAANIIVAAPGGANRTLTLGTVTAPNGGQAIVPVTLAAQGNETGLSGSVTFPVGANGLTISNVGGTNPDVLPGTALPAGCTVTTNATQVATGSIGFLIACPTAIPAGAAQQVLRLRFGVPAGTPVPRTLPLTWGDAPIARGTTDANAAALPTTYVNGAVNVDVTTAQGATLNGRVTDANGAGVRNAVITISGPGLSEAIRVTTGSLGYFSVENLEVGQTYLVSLRAAKRYNFPNATRLVTMNDGVQNVDFSAVIE